MVEDIARFSLQWMLIDRSAIPNVLRCPYKSGRYFILCASIRIIYLRYFLRSCDTRSMCKQDDTFYPMDECFASPWTPYFLSDG